MRPWIEVCRSARARRGAVVALLVVLAVTPAAAQVAPEGPFAFQGGLDLENPGARSLGLGGAFIARADDSTAAVTNPAGLIHLRFPEVALEVRSREGEIEAYGPGGERSTLDSSSTGASFASVSYPLKRLTLALYRHELVDLDVSGSKGAARSSHLGVEVTGIGLAAAFEVFQWLRVGVAVVDYGSDFDGASISATRGATTIAGDESELGFTLGYQADLNENWSVGFVFRDLPSFDVDIESVGEVRSVEYTLPNVIGFGVAWQASHRLVTSFDYSVVQYSTTIENAESVGGTFVAPDAHQAKLGFEYTIWEYVTSPAFRLGVWRDPDHRVRWKPSSSVPSGAPLAGSTAEFPRGDDEIHFSVGAGVVLGAFQIDAAADFSDSDDTFALTVVFFP